MLTSKFSAPVQKHHEFQYNRYRKREINNTRKRNLIHQHTQAYPSRTMASRLIFFIGLIASVAYGAITTLPIDPLPKKHSEYNHCGPLVWYIRPWQPFYRCSCHKGICKFVVGKNGCFSCIPMKHPGWKDVLEYVPGKSFDKDGEGVKLQL